MVDRAVRLQLIAPRGYGPIVGETIEQITALLNVCAGGAGRLKTGAHARHAELGAARHLAAASRGGPGRSEAGGLRVHQPAVALAGARMAGRRPSPVRGGR